MVQKNHSQSPQGPILQPPSRMEQTLNSALSLLKRFQRYGRDFMGIGLLAIALMTLLALLAPELTSGWVLSLWRVVLTDLVGWGRFMPLMARGVMGGMVLRRQTNPGEMEGIPGQ